VALEGNGKTKSAINLLNQLHKTHPNNQEVLVALISYLQKLGDKKTAIVYAKRLLKQNPQLGTVEQILQRLASP